VAVRGGELIIRCQGLGEAAAAASSPEGQNPPECLKHQQHANNNNMSTTTCRQQQQHMSHLNQPACVTCFSEQEFPPEIIYK